MLSFVSAHLSKLDNRQYAFKDNYVAVIAKYKEDISWLTDLKCKYIVYDKSKDIPNIGREAETYLRDYPELAPKIYKCGTNSIGKEIDTLYLEFEWPEAVQSMINSLPEFRKRFQEKCEISISNRTERSVETREKPSHLRDETITEYT